jgi:hypothetical protein
MLGLSEATDGVLQPAFTRWWQAALAAAALAAMCLAHDAAAQAAGLPTFAELEASGARIGLIHVVTNNIFDTDDPKENKRLFRWANALHVRTRESAIEHALLFKSGDPLSVRVLDETERLLRGNSYLYDVQFRPIAVHGGVVDIEVATRDTWTLDPGFSAGRSGGENTSSVGIKENNLLGTGTSIGVGRFNGMDRSGYQFDFANQRAFGTRTSIAFTHSTNSDGERNAASVIRPFYALDTRWAAGLSASKDDRLDAVYNAGNVVSEYRHQEQRAEVFGGWSSGLVDGWVRRQSLGLHFEEDAFAPEPGLIAPALLPGDERRVGPFIRLQWIEDRFQAQRNRNLMGRPEYFALGLASSMQLTWASTALGSTHNALLYGATISRGFETTPDDTLLASASISGRYEDGRLQRQRLGAAAQYYRPQGRRWLFYASAAGDMLSRPAPTEELLLGGDNGLRGYPLRYQSGQRRALLTLEERFFTDWYVWRLFRVGGAAFFDVGRAWGGDNVNTANPGWLSNAGVGLRIVNTRSAFSNVLHLDMAFPLATASGISRVQFLVKAKTSF